MPIPRMECEKCVCGELRLDRLPLRYVVIVLNPLVLVIELSLT